MDHLQAASLTINHEKSILKPVRRLTYCGLVIDLDQLRVCPTQEKLKRLMYTLVLWELRSLYGRKVRHRLQGYLNYALPLVGLGNAILQMHHPAKQFLTLMPQLRPIPLRPVSIPPFNVFHVDASTSGVAVVQNDIVIVSWPLNITHRKIYAAEMMALLLAALLAKPFDHIFSDNQAAIWSAYSSRRSSHPTLQILVHLLVHSKSLKVNFIPTELNKADTPSRPKSDFSHLQHPLAGEKYNDHISRRLK